MNILSIQSHVAYGHVGNSAIVLPLQRLGHEVWPVHTVMLSNHAGYPDHAGRTVSAGELAGVIDGLDRRGALAHCDGILSGYLGDVAAGGVVLDAVARVRNANEGALYCCDPVMGDDGEIYVDAEIVAFMCQRAAPAADILTPNLFELSILAESAPDALNGAPLDEIIAAARKLIEPDYRTSTVLVTSVDHAALASEAVAMAAVNSAGAWLVTTPAHSFDVSPHGAGDLCAALFCVALLAGNDAAEALSRTASAVHALLTETARLGKSELALVEAQDVMVAPEKFFRAESIF
ncbi:MAG: pyridoxal kinase PdxY [Alphaproteobacteria bacterium]|nr:pyridoxal kinase PdxY [Alphaproteobacteria bacterium]